jgi:V-type H+-transporting ATPase subunit A
VAKIIRDDMLQQNAFTDYDVTCPLHKSVAIMKVGSFFFTLYLLDIDMDRPAS